MSRGTACRTIERERGSQFGLGSSERRRGTNVSVLVPGHHQHRVHFPQRLLLIWQAERLAKQVLWTGKSSSVGRSARREGGRLASLVGSRQYDLRWCVRRDISAASSG